MDTGRASRREVERRTEGALLSLFVLPILVCSLCLVFLARTPGATGPGTVNLNRATVDEIALTLQIDPALARTVVSARDRSHGFAQVDALAAIPLFPPGPARDRVVAAARREGDAVSRSDAGDLAKALGIDRPSARRLVEYRDQIPGHVFRSPEAIGRVPILDSGRLAAVRSELIVRTPAVALLMVLGCGASLAILFLFLPVVLRRLGVAGDPTLLPCAFVLCSLSVALLYGIKDPLRDMPAFAHQTGGVWGGAVLFALAAAMRSHGSDRPGSLARLLPSRGDLRRYTYLWALLALGLLVALAVVGAGPGRTRISLAFFQPVEAIKLLMALFTAGYLAERGDILAGALRRWRPPLPKRLSDRFRGIALPRASDIGPLAAFYMAALLLFLVVRDMGPALLLFGAFACTLYLATARPGILFWAGAASALGGLLAYLLHVGVVPVRVDMWLAPWSNVHPNGTQVGQGLWAFASGGISGTGLGLGSPGLVPRAGSDMIFAAVGEELGLVGAVTMLTIYVAILWRMLRAAQRAETDFDRLLAAALASMLACQVALIVCGVTGLIPLTGLSLPFLGYGNSALVADFLVLGILRGISDRSPSVPVGFERPVFQHASKQLGFAVAVLLLGVVGIGRLFYVQAFAADRVAASLLRTPDADGVARPRVNPRLLAIERTIERGTIYDRNGRVLATSRLAEISVAVDGDQRRAAALYRRGRFWPRGSSMANVVGYSDPAMGGPTGLEATFNVDLRGFGSYADLVADYRAKDLPRFLSGRSQRHGRDVVTTLNADLQDDAVRVLRGAVRRSDGNGQGAPAGAMVVLAPATGEVLVCATTPSFDPNEERARTWPALLADADGLHRLLDRARNGLYPPGSTVKVAVAAAALDAGVSPTYECSRRVRDLRWHYRGATYGRAMVSDDRGDPPHGRIGLSRALAASCNVYFAQLGISLGAERLHREFVDQLDFRHVRTAGAFAVDLPDNAYGQGTMLVTPMEMARLAAAVANGGRVCSPIFWKAVRAGGADVRTATPLGQGRAMGDATAAQLSQMMRRVTGEGTARYVFDGLPVQVAGKTGTAETSVGRPHSWFIGYAPFTHPQYAVACVVEHGGYGRRSAAPAVRTVFQEAFGR